MKKSKIGAVVLSMALASAVCVPATAFAANAWDPSTTYGTPADNVTAGDSSATTELKGVIKPTTLSVSVPTNVVFAVDPGAAPDFTGAPASTTVGQFTSPTNYTITNNSRVPIYAAVTGVTATDVELVSDANNLTAGTEATPKVMVAINDKGNSDGTTGNLLSIDASGATITQTGNWLATTGITADAPYYAFHQDDATAATEFVNGKLAAGKDSTGAAVTDGTNKSTMYVYGAVKGEGWNTNDSFTVTPTFTIKTVEF